VSNGKDTISGYLKTELIRLSESEKTTFIVLGRAALI